uniref:Uncharacterized protein n=1 Tax=Salix viminalis TaxID=40686 RepID=A0A6N2MLK2_SALVM
MYVYANNIDFSAARNTLLRPILLPITARSSIDFSAARKHSALLPRQADIVEVPEIEERPSRPIISYSPHFSLEIFPGQQTSRFYFQFIFFRQH